MVGKGVPRPVTSIRGEESVPCRRPTALEIMESRRAQHRVKEQAVTTGPVTLVRINSFS